MIPRPETVKRTSIKNNSPQVISITSGKGGVGKTSIVANMAILLSSMGKKVLVFDADLGLANIDVMLGLSVKYNINHLLQGDCKIKDILIEGPAGIKILPASSGIQELSVLSYEQQLTLINALDNFQEDFDYMLVDTGAGISGNVMYFNSAAQRIVVVVTPEPTSLTDAYALIKVMRTRFNIKRFEIIINNVLSTYEGKEVIKKLIFACDNFFGDIALDMLGSIPHDSTIPDSIREQRAFVEINPSSEASRRLAAIVKRIDSINAPHERGSLQFFFKRHIENREKG
jgi:flagellar biosynthesis protein FlhG